MRTRGLVGVLVLVAAVDGCALVYGYGDYHSDTTSGGAQGGSTSSAGHGGGGAGAGAGGHAGGGGNSGGGGSACPTPTGNEPYAVTWSNLYGDTLPVNVVGVRVGATHEISLAATFSGALQLGSDHLQADGSTAMLVGQFKANGQPVFAKAFTGNGSVTATTLAVDGSGNPYAFGTFDNSVTLGSVFNVGMGGDINTVVAALSKANGSLLGSNARVITCTDNGGACSVSVAAASFAGPSGTDLYLAGTFKGGVNFGGTASLNESDANGFGAIYGTAAYELKGNGDAQAMNGFVRSSDGELIFGGTVTAASYFNLGICVNGGQMPPPPMGSDIAVMKYKDTPTTGVVWSCPTSVLVEANDQNLDALIPTDDGGAFIAGRTTGGLNLGNGDIAGTGIFVARFDMGRNLLWNTIIPTTPTSDPVHLELTADALVLSGGFSQSITLDGDTVQSANPSGFVLLLTDIGASGTGAPGWGRALVSCADDAATSLIASATDDGTIAIAGTIEGPSQIAGKTLGLGTTQPRIFVASLDKK